MKKIHRKYLLMDTNLLLLLLIGSLSPSRIRIEKVTANQGFDEQDFKQLCDYVGKFQKLVSTPHILTEVSNHADKIKSNRGQLIQQFISLIETLDERSEKSELLARTDAFPRFGLTDAAISHLADEAFVVLTTDFPLSGFLRKKGVYVINFNHVRWIPQTAWA